MIRPLPSVAGGSQETAVSGSSGPGELTLNLVGPIISWCRDTPRVFIPSFGIRGPGSNRWTECRVDRAAGHVPATSRRDHRTVLCRTLTPSRFEGKRRVDGRPGNCRVILARLARSRQRTQRSGLRPGTHDVGQVTNASQSVVPVRRGSSGSTAKPLSRREESRASGNPGSYESGSRPRINKARSPGRG